jgi:hypothetical protein
LDGCVFVNPMGGYEYLSYDFSNRFVATFEHVGVKT